MTNQEINAVKESFRADFEMNDAYGMRGSVYLVGQMQNGCWRLDRFDSAFDFVVRYCESVIDVARVLGDLAARVNRALNNDPAILDDYAGPVWDDFSDRFPGVAFIY